MWTFLLLKNFFYLAIHGLIQPNFFFYYIIFFYLLTATVAKSWVRITEKQIFQSGRVYSVASFSHSKLDKILSKFQSLQQFQIL